MHPSLSCGASAVMPFLKSRRLSHDRDGERYAQANELCLH